jgi:E3 ubiquitin-protein ligase MARCH6
VKVRQTSWNDPNALALTVDVIAPCVGGLILMIIFPPAIFLPMQWIYNRMVPSSILFDDKSLCEHIIFISIASPLYLSCQPVRYVYPLLFIAALASQAVESLRGILKSWAQIIRDNEFLLELRLKNLDHDKPEETPQEKTASSEDL